MDVYDEFVELLNRYSIQDIICSVDECPCGKLEIFGIRIEVHCWGVCCDYGCKFSGVHVQNMARDDLGAVEYITLYDIGKLVADAVQQLYDTNVDVVVT